MSITPFKLLAILARAAMPPGKCGCLPCAHFPAEGVYVERQDDYVYVVALDENRLHNLKVLSAYEYEAVVGTIPQLDGCSFHSSHVLPTTECPPLYTPDVLTIAEDNSPCCFNLSSMPSPPATPMDAPPTEFLPLLSTTEDKPPCVALSTPLPPALPRLASATPKKAVKSAKVVSSNKISHSRTRQSISKAKDATLHRKPSSPSVSLPGSASDTNIIEFKRSTCAQASKSTIEYWALLDKVFELVTPRFPEPWVEYLQCRLFPHVSVKTVSNHLSNRNQNWGSVDPNPIVEDFVLSRPKSNSNSGRKTKKSLNLRLTAIQWSTTWTDKEFMMFVEENIIPYKDRIVQEYVLKADTVPGFGNRLNIDTMKEVVKYEKKVERKFFPELNQILKVSTIVPTTPMPPYVFAAER